MNAGTIDDSTSGWLDLWGEGDPGAIDRVMPTIYRDLRRLAAHYLSGESNANTLQPTALVHDAYLRLGAARGYDCKARGQLMAIVSRIMRHILIDNARARGAAKRDSGGLQPEPGPTDVSLDLLALDMALGLLETEHPRSARVVELRFFGDLGLSEIADVLELSLSSVERDWRFARAWLHDRMNPVP